jgi:alkylation response protein AidB-like acyl-CoA dehydrogenase
MTLDDDRTPLRIEAIERSIDDLAAEFEAEAPRCEQARRPTDALADLMRRARIPMSKVAREVGGCEISPARQIDFFARLAYLNPTAGWIGFNYSGVLGILSATLPEAGLEALFSGSTCPLVAAVSAPTGRSEAVVGGYVVKGRWAYASGVTCADYVFLTTIGGDPPRPIGVLLPTNEICLHDDWHTAALQGTGSVDVSVEGVFVPKSMTCSPFEPIRGGAQYRGLGYRGYVGGENFGFSLGVARRLVDETAELTRTKRRVLDPTPVADRGAFQQALGRTDASLRAARAYLMDEFDRAMALAEQSDAPLSPHETARLGAAVGWATETVVQAATQLFPYAGAGALHVSSPIQRALRDVIGSGQHIVATNETLDAWGRALLEKAD